MDLKTNRLNIRKITIDDWESLKEIIGNFESSKYAIYDTHFPKEKEAFKNSVKIFADSNLFFGVFLNDDDKMIGYICFHNNEGKYDLGYCFHSDYQGKGYAFEGCLSVLKYIEENFNVKGFTAGTALENIPSCKLLEKLGFVCTETEKMSFHKDELGNDITFNGGSFLYKD